MLAKFFASIEWWKLVPDDAIFADGPAGGDTRNAAMRSTAGDCLVIYLSSNPGSVSLHLDRMSAPGTAQATWVDPQTGTRTHIGQFPAAGKRSFSPPKGWRDALLLIEAKR